MTFLIGLPVGSEWIFLIGYLIFLFPIPILTIVLYFKNRELKKQIKIMTAERNVLIQKLPDHR
ncbi:hypothetical protein [Ferruginibacter sp.]|uniref:hypothetical protein n=1 Tax=Ferruginibacter sp. TaxID=1940288 RepID=UPI0026585ECD|nr:hypothetical protein [Ferruginibacter sp.]